MTKELMGELTKELAALGRDDGANAIVAHRKPKALPKAASEDATSSSK